MATARAFDALTLVMAVRRGVRRSSNAHDAAQGRNALR